ncbi:hypothetical protein AN958_11547 [Leucoagaricus sp. SymC.cos]|nr:hypothetical protein AN958_11547 [Leucoagaricus sp. SymC.cos]
MASVDGQLYTIKVHDALLERKTAENLLCVIKDVINTIEVEWEGRVTALVTDASGECRKAKIDLVKDWPSIIALDCFTHQNSLRFTSSNSESALLLFGEVLYFLHVISEGYKIHTCAMISLTAALYTEILKQTLNVV